MSVYNLIFLTIGERLHEWCFTPLPTVFQPYHFDSSHYSCLGLGILKCFAKGQSNKKKQRIQCDMNPDPELLDYETKHFTTEPCRTSIGERLKLDIFPLQINPVFIICLYQKRFPSLCEIRDHTT